MAKKADPQTRRILVARDSFTANVDGVDVQFTAGETRVHEGHPLLKKLGHLFEPIKVHYEVEQATAAPTEKRGA